MKLAINGAGRIGRLVLRAALSRGVDVVAINDVGCSIEYLVYLCNYDSVHKWDTKFSIQGTDLAFGDKIIKFYAERDPASLPWAELRVDVVLECTGIFLTSGLANKHLAAGAKRVILSAPPKDNTPTFVLGVNEHLYDPSITLLSNASCTTNCLAPVVKILDDEFGIEEGFMTTIHAATMNQTTVDGMTKGGKDWRAGRCVLNNIIPATTGAAKAVGKVLPHLEGKINGMAFRVPTADVSVVDFVARVKKPVQTVSDLETAFEKHLPKLQGIVSMIKEDVVSTDFTTDSHSSTIDIKSCMVMPGGMIKVVSWYDNEWGYSNRLIELAQYTHSKHES